MSYEIDKEICEFLSDMAGAADSRLLWSKTLPVGVNKKDHFEGFAEIPEIANQIIYDRTKKFSINYMLASATLRPVLMLIDAFKPAAKKQMNGPYFLGTLNGSIKVYIHPDLEAGRFVCGVNYDELQATAAVYAPYMPVIPTNVIQFNDGLSEQGFATMYDLVAINDQLVVAGKVTD